MALEYVKTKVLTPYDRTILPITLAEFSLYGDRQGAYDITDPTTIEKINKYTDIVRSNLEYELDAPLLHEEWVYSAYVSDAPYKKYQINKVYIKDYTKISIRTNELDNANQYIWYDIPSADWFGYTKKEKDFVDNYVEVQTNTEHKTLNTKRTNENIKITFIRGLFADVNSINNDIKSAIATVVFQMIDGTKNPDDTCVVEAIIKSYDTSETMVFY